LTDRRADCDGLPGKNLLFSLSSALPLTAPEMFSETPGLEADVLPGSGSGWCVWRSWGTSQTVESCWKVLKIQDFAIVSGPSSFWDFVIVAGGEPFSFGKEKPVIVECKQGSPTRKHLKQLRGYMKRLQKETGGKDARGILVHGGSRKLRREVIMAATLTPRVQIVQYLLRVDFAGGPSS
jgi:hypothetical protein